MLKLTRRQLVTNTASLTLLPHMVRAAYPITRIVAGYEKLIYLPVTLTDSLGHFREQGLEVVLVNGQDGLDSEDALLDGSIQGVIGFYDHCVVSASKGKTLLSVVQLGQAVHSCPIARLGRFLVPLARPHVILRFRVELGHTFYDLRIDGIADKP